MKSELSYELMARADRDPQLSSELLEPPELRALERSVSCPGELQYQFDNVVAHHQHRQHHRIRIAYYNDSVRERSQANAQRLLLLAAAAMVPAAENCSETNSAILARKALRYRKIYDRMDGVDVTDPCFNASQFLGVTWHKLVP